MATNVNDKIQEAVAKELGVSNPHALPRITKVVVSAGVGKNRDDKAYLESVVKDLTSITGQYPQARRAKKAVAGFKVRQHNLVGYRVTLRGQRMKDFTERFVNVTLPRVRDFRGLVTTSLDGNGNLSVGLSEHLAFPEVQADQTDVIFGVEVTFVTSTKDEALGFPFNK